MPLHNNYFKIGLFAFAGLGLFLAGLLAFGLRGSLKPTLQCVTFFDRSVQGISRDSSVKFRGFEVGRVTSIALSSVEDKDGPPVVRVMFSIDPAALGGKNSDVEEARAYMLRQVEHGLQAVLSFQGVTGLGFLDLDYREKAPGASLEALGARVSADQLVFVPNGPGSIMEISESATQIVKSLREVDFAGLSRDINALVQKVDEAVGDIKMAGLSSDLRDALKEVGQAAAEVSALARGLDASLLKNGSGDKIVGETEVFLKQLRAALRRADQLLAAAQGDLPAAMDNLRVMSENLRELSELAKNYPSQVLFGQPPQEARPVRPGKP